MAVVGTPTLEDTSCTVDGDYNLSYTSVYHVITNDPLDGPNTVSAPATIPRYGDPYVAGNDSNQYAFANGATIKRLSNDGTLRHWLVTVTYSTKTQNSRKTDSSMQRPIDEPVKVSGSYIRGTKAVQHEIDGKILANSAEEPKIAEVPYGHDTLVIEKNTPTIDLLKRAKAIFKINKATIWGLPAHSLLLSQWSYETLYYGRTAYVKNHLEFEISYDTASDGTYIGWKLDLLDAGFRILFDRSKSNPDDRYVTPMPNDMPLAKPILLDGTGSWLDVNKVPNGLWLEKRIIQEYDFSLLSFIPDPLPGPFA